MYPDALMPKLGEVARCKRCRTTYIAIKCDCGHLHCEHVGLVSPKRAGIDGDIAARLVADRTSEFCPKCITPDERTAMHAHQHAVRRGEACN